MKLSIQGRKQHKSKGEDAWFLLFFFLLSYHKHDRNPSSPWSSRPECLIEWLLPAERALNLLSRVFLGGTRFLPEEVCRVRQISDLGSCLSQGCSLWVIISTEKFIRKVCQKPWSELRASVMGSHFKLGMPGRREVFEALGFCSLILYICNFSILV